jgi:glycosyltransferase involved in cell wall biosynthesis
VVEEVWNMSRTLRYQNGPLISVVVPCYNYGDYLPASVGSVLAQDGVNVEVIIVDDASPDGSIVEANRLARRDSRVSVIAHERNRGHIASYNEGLEGAKGDYVVLLSADDMLAAGSLQRALKVMEDRPEVGFTYGPAIKFASAPPSVRVRDARIRVWDGRAWLQRRCFRVTNCIFSPEVVMRRSVYRQVGPYRSDMPLTGDLAMWMRAAAVADVAYIAGPPAAYYRLHGLNMHTQTHNSGRVEGMIFDLEQRRTAFQSVLDAPLQGRADLQNLHASAMRRLSAEALAAAARGFAWGLADTWPIDDLIRFGFETYAQAADLPEWRRLKYRLNLGTTRARAHVGIQAEEKVLGWLRALSDWHETTVHA